MVSDDFDPDGFVIVHYPKDGSERYGIGPFPAIDDLWDMLTKDSLCGCRKERLWVRFPRGATMVIMPTAEAVELMRSLVMDPDADRRN